MVTLSILIPITESRRDLSQRLRDSLARQTYNKPVEVILNWNETDNAGVKRNKLLQRAKGRYVVFIDSDDLIDGDYVDKILMALEHNPDCVGISGYMTTDGAHLRGWRISLLYEEWGQRDGLLVRSPNHISPVRRDIAVSVGFPEIARGEDAEYSKRLVGKLKSEVIVSGDLYHYRFRSKKKN